MNKREFLRYGSGLVAIAGGVSYAFAGAEVHLVSRRVTAPGIAIHDERYPDSMRFARGLPTNGTLRIPVQTDIVRLWHGKFPEVLQEDRAWIGGLTTGSDQALVEACVKPYGFKSCFIGRHDGRGAEQLTHTLDYRGADLDLAGIFTDEYWALHLAVALVTRGLSEGDARTAMATSPRPAAYPGTLFSWLLVRYEWNNLAKTQSTPRKQI